MSKMPKRQYLKQMKESFYWANLLHKIYNVECLPW